MTSAALCRRKRWAPGTLLRCVGYGVTATIQITAVGMDGILARRFDEAGFGYETAWTLGCRDWEKVGFQELRSKKRPPVIE